MKALVALCVLASSAYADPIDLPNTKATLDLPPGWAKLEVKDAGKGFVADVPSDLRVWDARPEGRFVAYQFRSKVKDLGEPVFGARTETHSGFWNVPPMKIYVWRQREALA